MFRRRVSEALMPHWLTQLFYLTAAVLYHRPQGHELAGDGAAGQPTSFVGMVIAILVTLADRAIVSYWVILAGMVSHGLVMAGLRREDDGDAADGGAATGGVARVAAGELGRVPARLSDQREHPDTDRVVMRPVC